MEKVTLSVETPDRIKWPSSCPACGNNICETEGLPIEIKVKKGIKATFAGKPKTIIVKFCPRCASRTSWAERIEKFGGGLQGSLSCQQRLCIHHAINLNGREQARRSGSVAFLDGLVKAEKINSWYSNHKDFEEHMAISIQEQTICRCVFSNQPSNREKGLAESATNVVPRVKFDIDNNARPASFIVWLDIICIKC